ncbi:uncharacterized protein BJ171DRAFT_505799, partial [Polychytrium aggregatum]|uniref:uncharacterized protein n=1 Tax=Polychytrium aggregatum TaxID=110093 RepID=UPI0022FDD891
MTENPDDILKQDANNSDTVSGVELPEPSASPDAVANPAVEQPVHIGPQTSQTNETGPEEAALVTKVTESSNAVPAAIKETDHSAEVSVSPPADEISESAGPTLAADQPNPEHTPEPESVAVMSTPVDPAATTSPSETETSGSKVHHTYIKLAAEPDVHEADFEPVTVASAPEHSVTKAEEAATDLV